VGLNASETLLMPMSGMEGLRTGQYIEPVHRPLTTPVGPSLLGRVIDAHGQPMDGKRQDSLRRRIPHLRRAATPARTYH